MSGIAPGIPRVGRRDFGVLWAAQMDSKASG